MDYYATMKSNGVELYEMTYKDVHSVLFNGKVISE